MRSATPKVLHPLLGRSLLGHVLAAADELAADRTVVVVGVGADQVTSHLTEIAPKAIPVVQSEQRGTGHAVRTALSALDLPGPAEGGAGGDAAAGALGVAGAGSSTVVVLYGDTPLLRAETVTGLVAAHETAGAAATLLSATVPDPTGLGRIIRDPDGGLARIVEERDASPEQRAINEINAGVYAFDGALLAAALRRLDSANDQGEEYLTDVPGMLVGAGHLVAVHQALDATDTRGCNDRVELAALRALLRDRVNSGLMRSGVTILDPATAWIDVTVAVGRDAVIDQNTQLRGATAIAEGAVVGPDVTLIDTTVGERATVVRAHAVESTIGPGAQVGPYASLRPASRLSAGAKVGTFVETKNSEIGSGAKVAHQAYVGDATIGPKANIGAGTIVVNYDGVSKHHTQVGEAAFVGSNSNLVAPVEIGDGAYVAAGSTVVNGVPPGNLGVARATQRNIDGWVRRRRPGTKSARAAAEAAGSDAAEPKTGFEVEPGTRPDPSPPHQ